MEMFNEQGIEYVQLRGLAADLGMRVSNITYYFPTKDDLVFRIAQGLARSNEELFQPVADLDPRKYFSLLHRVFHNHIRYRCLLRSFVHLMEQNQRLREQYKRNQTDRRATMGDLLRQLETGGYLKFEDPEALDAIISTISLIARFWLSEAPVALRGQPFDQQALHYLRLVARLLLPYATAKGRSSIRKAMDAGFPE
ncbi:MAG: TetR family transcriptional regulator [Chitinophagaceae bacterium]|nr:MAG: TetR family transcriptional regulator [Chitinophagaceae bacterium]